ncbi:DUF2306 domain-containing protein [Brevundimonas sp.]|uniref:DUF2306 domain-containing protein n=1 Tax=Brevundimonas sp. TaxID=1871086 RepID=UPI0025BE5DC7|nr:DUF2306 domain-containing protein [Brevundimonas sp.]
MPAPSPSLPLASRLLRWAGAAWFVAAVVGQAAFIVFILAFYGLRTATGNFAGWNDKPLIDGYVAGDDLGNLVFIAHVLMAAVVTLGGLMQLWPALRRRLPRLHRWTGRAFLVVAVKSRPSPSWATPSLSSSSPPWPGDARFNAGSRRTASGRCAPSWRSAGSGSCASA